MLNPDENVGCGCLIFMVVMMLFVICAKLLWWLAFTWTPFGW